MSKILRDFVHKNVGSYRGGDKFKIGSWLVEFNSHLFEQLKTMVIGNLLLLLKSNYTKINTCLYTAPPITKMWAVKWIETISSIISLTIKCAMWHAYKNKDTHMERYDRYETHKYRNWRKDEVFLTHTLTSSNFPIVFLQER